MSTTWITIKYASLHSEQLVYPCTRKDLLDVLHTAQDADVKSVTLARLLRGRHLLQIFSAISALLEFASCLTKLAWRI
ncbi:uncharacterized protein PHALS_14743 [Plasmopara halstedii]|uniref:Uncharacterized protein n=1 Tax=Plasmopara halstedii TaxID=4781 RepID=A0A0P1AUR2_PLAHL|nr:uncharacterized protein PHALS_14743 [Plasmopara halstedii]CEG45090.1 hypothetical protein PHALS_14743 [Plasmopara halstedii]|eukprot:XP_024581459.1 hypothetical protein PHALS_14743 [Plasmopara halstedii]